MALTLDFPVIKPRLEFNMLFVNRKSCIRDVNIFKYLREAGCYDYWSVICE